MLEMTRVRAGYGRLTVLFDIELAVMPGEMVAIHGANGAGKSTLLKSLLGLVKVTDGTIVFNETRIERMPSHERFGMGISLCPEGRRMFPNLSVRENLLCGSYGTKAQDRDAQLEVFFNMFPVLGERQKQRAGSLSGGEQQMVAISRALMSQPQLLMVDELSLGLAPLIVQQLLVTLRELCDRGLSVLVVDQVASRLAKHADRSIALQKGRIVEVEESTFLTVS